MTIALLATVRALLLVYTGGLVSRPLRIKESLRPYYLRWFYFKLFPQSRPAEFSECWRFPCFPLQADDLAEHLEPCCPPAFLFFPMTDVHARVQRTQHLARALAERGHPCFLLNPHLGRQFPVVFAADSQPKFGLLREQLAELHIRLPAEPVYHRRLLQNSESRRLADAMAPLSALSGGGVQQILSLPTWLDAAMLLRSRYGWPIVYDCHDLISGFPGISEDIIAGETRALDEADLVLFTSESLLQDRVARSAVLQKKSRILRNAADPEHFAAVAPRRRSRGAKRGVIGYIGALDEWFDIDAVRACVERFPERKCQLIGRIEYQPIRSLAKFPNVELMGEVAYEKLPDLVAGFDVGLIPFRITPLTRATNPIKLYEYFSCGLPVVSSRLPEVEMFDSLAYLANDSSEFPRLVGQALEEASPEKEAARMEVARRETWSERVAMLMHATESLFPGAHSLDDTGAKGSYRAQPS